jgi:hypothetical protein
MARAEVIVILSAHAAAGATPGYDFDHLEDSVFAPDSRCLWCADTSCDGNSWSSTFDPDDFYEATTFFMQQLQPLVANAKLDRPLYSHPTLSRELMLTRLEADDWGDTADGTHYVQEEHEYAEHYDISYEQQELPEHTTEQHYQGTDFDEHEYTEESHEQEHTLEQAAPD